MRTRFLPRVRELWAGSEHTDPRGNRAASRSGRWAEATPAPRGEGNFPSPGLVFDRRIQLTEGGLIHGLMIEPLTPGAVAGVGQLGRLSPTSPGHGRNSPPPTSLSHGRADLLQLPATEGQGLRENTRHGGRGGKRAGLPTQHPGLTESLFP